MSGARMYEAPEDANACRRSANAIGRMFCLDSTAELGRAGYETATVAAIKNACDPNRVTH